MTYKTEPANKTVIVSGDPEVLPPESTALATLQPGQLADAPPIAQLAMLENVTAIVGRMAEAVASVRMAAIKMSDPVDWVLNKDRQGNEIAMLTASGAQKIAGLYGIKLAPLPGRSDLEPSREQNDGRISYVLKCIAFSRLLGRDIEIEATRREDEDFTGRSTNAAGAFDVRGERSFEPDLKKSVRTLAQTTAVRELVGLKNVSRHELDAAWAGTTKSTARCRFGHGYGTSNERVAQGVAEGGVTEKAKGLWEECLRQAGGDVTEAGAILREITSYPAGQRKDGTSYNAFDGVKSYQQITTQRNLDSAWRKLRDRA